MRQVGRPGVIEYFAYLPFGQKVGLALDLLRRHILILLGLNVIFGTVFCVLFVILIAVSGLGLSELSANLNAYGAYGRPVINSTSIAILLTGCLGLTTLYYFFYLGLHTLMLQYINRKTPPAFSSIFSPVTDRPGGALLSFLLWLLLTAAALTGAIMAVALASALIPEKSIRLFLTVFVLAIVLIIMATVAQCAVFYIGDCLGRGRRFRVLETVGKPIRLVRLNFWPYLGAAIFTELLYFLPPVILDKTAEALQSGSGKPEEGLGLILLTLLLSGLWQLVALMFGIFFMGLTYKQAKARFLLKAQGDPRFR